MEEIERRVEQLDLVLSQVDFSLASVEDDRDDFDEEYCKLQAGEYSPEQYRDLLARRARTRFGQLWSNYRKAMLDLAGLYLSAQEQNRRWIRRVVSEKNRVRFYVAELVEEQVRLVSSTDDAGLFKKVLASVSMADPGADLAYSLQFVLTPAFHQAREAGIDVRAVFYEIGLLSSTEPREPVGKSASEFLANFEPLRSWG